jgi:haloalkane dehalogenase
MMLHGNPTWSFYYRKLIPELSKQYRVIVPDHIGCGLSDKPQKYAYTLEHHINNVERLIESLKLENITFVLHDWGGAIGMGCAVRQPELMKAFVILNTAAFFVPVLPWHIKVCRIPWLGAFLVRGLNGFVLGAQLFATSQCSRFTKEVRSGYLAPYNNWRNRVAIHQFVQDIPMSPHHPTRATIDAIEAGLGQFHHHPMLILWGDDDFCFTTCDFLPKWREHFPQADVRVFPHVGHYIVEDAHEQILPIMQEFLKKKINH